MRIIHFSDFHLDNDQITRCMDLVERMILALQQIHKEKAIDVIVFSGDLIDRAGCNFLEPKMKNGFEKFEEVVIKPITTALGLPANRFIFTLGNHDVNQKADKKRANTNLTKKLRDAAEVDRFINQKDVETKIPRIAEFNKFRDDYWTRNKGDAEVDVTPLQIGIKFVNNGLKIGFNCLNTAWRCYESKTDIGTIVTGKSQITREHSFFNDCQLTFAVGHHLPSMMNSFESVDLEKVLAANYDACFYGHTHSGDGKMIIRPQGSCFFFIAPGTLTWNISEDAVFENGFMVVDYEKSDNYLDAQKYYQDENDNFVRDNNYGYKGVWHEQLPGSSVMRTMANSLFLQKKDEQFYSNAYVNNIIDNLKNSKNDTIHFVALSGLGKTRIIREAFDDGFPHPNYYYCEFSDAESVILYDIDHLLVDHGGKEGLIVLDNCPNELLLKVIEKRNTYNSKFRIIGVNNAFYERQGVRNAVSLQIPLSQDNVRDKVEEYIEQNIPVINGDTSVRDQIKRIADGFPGMANLLVKEYRNSKDVNVHTVDALVRKLLKFDPDMHGDDKIVMQSLALFQPCPYQAPYKDAFKFIRDNESITPLFRRTPQEKRYLFNKTINKHGNSLIEISACWLNIRPFPLAVWLVSKWFEEDNDEERFEEIVSDIEKQEKEIYEVLKEGLYKRLEYMRDSADAQSLIDRLTNGPKASFCNEKVVCSDLGSRLFLAMSSVNPVAIARCLNTVLLSKTVVWVREKVDSDIRRNLVWALEKLCFDKFSYDDASKVMALLAVAENEEWGNNASGQFKQLFHIYLPGTEVTLEKRAGTLEYLMSCGEEYQDLLLDCIDRAFDSGHFVRDGAASQFGLEKKTDYAPSTNKEIIDYWMACSRIMLQVLDKDLTTINRISKIVEDHVIRWSMDGMLARLFPMLEDIASKRECGWSELYTVMSRTKTQKLSFYPEDFLRQYELFLTEIRPKTFCQKLKDARLLIYNDYESPLEKQLKKEREIFRSLAKEFVEEKIYESKQELLLITEDKEYNDIWFSPALKEFMSDEQVKIVMGVFLSLICEKGGDSYRSSFVFRFCYVFRDSIAFSELIDHILDYGFYDLYMRLISHCETENYSSYTIMRKKMEEGRLGKDAPAKYLNYVSTPYQHQLCELIKRIRIDYPELHDDLMDYVVRQQFDKEMFKDADTLTIIKELILEYDIKEDNNRNINEYSRFVAELLDNYHDEVLAAKINRKLMKVLKNSFLRTNVEGIYPVLVKKYIKVIWRDFSRAFKNNNYYLFIYQIKDEIGSGSGFGVGPLFQIDKKRLEYLCSKYPDYAPHIMAEMCPIFRYDSEKDKEEGGAFHSWVYWLLDNYGDQHSVLDSLHANICSFSWTGSVIPLLEQRKECFEKITKHQRLEVRNWAEQCIKEVEEEYTRENNREEYIRLHYE